MIEEPILPQLPDFEEYILQGEPNLQVFAYLVKYPHKYPLKHPHKLTP